MKKKDRDAISNLNKHREKLSNPSSFTSAWISKLIDMLRIYLRHESHLFKNAESWYSFAEEGSKKHIKIYTEILEHSVESIQENGVLSEKKFWRFI